MNWKGRHQRRAGMPLPGFRMIGLGFAAVAISVTLQAQVSLYTFNQTQQPYTEITNGLQLGSTASGQAVCYVTSDGAATTGSSNGASNFMRSGNGIPIGFDFVFNGLVFDRIGVAPQGWISFGHSSNSPAVWAHGWSASSTPPLSYVSGAPAPVTAFNRVSAFARSTLQQSANAPTGEIRVETIGSSPNQICVIQWKNISVGTNADRFNFQIRLYQSDNAVEVIYKDPSTDWIAAQEASVQVGLRGATAAYTATDFNRVYAPVVEGAYNWTTMAVATVNSTATTSNAVGGNLSYVVKPPAGTTFRWVPPTCFAPTNLALSQVQDDQVELTWNNGVGGGVYEYAVNTINNPTSGSPITGGSAVTAPMAATGLAGNTKYYAYIRQNCGAGDYSGWVAVPNRSVTSGANTLDANAFTTAPACGEAFNKTFHSGISSGLDGQWTVCADPGDVAKVSFSAFNVNSGSSALYIHNGATTASPLVHSGAAGVTAPANASGGYYGTNPFGTYVSQTGGCLTFRYLSGGGGDSWSATVECTPAPTCAVPSGIALTPTSPVINVALSSAAAQVQYRVVANGALPSAAAVATGVVSSWPFGVNSSSILGNTPYSMYVRAVCAPGDTSDWTPRRDFRTVVGCGGNMVFFPGGVFGGAAYPINTDSVFTLCPNNVGDVVTLTHTMFSIAHSQGAVGYYVHDGPNTSAPLISSGLQGHDGNTVLLPPGGFYGPGFRYDAAGGSPANLPGPFTSTHASGCLTVHFRSGSTVGHFDRGVEANVTCGAPPACARPHGVSVAGTTQTGTTVSWTGGGSDYIVEYGPAGFTPGTGNTAGGGTIIPGASSPTVIGGLSATTGYDVYVRRVCAGPSWSANSYLTRFSTSKDCSSASVVVCGEMNSAVFTGGAGSPAYQGAYYTGAACAMKSVAGPLTPAASNGAEYLFRFTAPETGTYQLNLPTSSLTSSTYAVFMTQPVADGCAAGGFTCVGVSQVTNVPVSGTQAPSTHSFNLTAGDHYILVDGLPLNGTQSFEILCPGLPTCIQAPTFPVNGQAFGLCTTPINFSWPARFGATLGYNIYFNDELLVANHLGTSISDADFNPQELGDEFGFGTEITWRAVPVNELGEAEGCENWTFRVDGGNTGTVNAVPLYAGQPVDGNNMAAYCFPLVSNVSPSGQGPGAETTYIYTAGPCAQSVNLTLCVRKDPTQASNPATRLFVLASNFSTVLGTGGTSNVAANQVCGNNYDRRITNVAVTPGQTYYVVVDGGGLFVQNQYMYTLELTENANATDTDGDGVPDCQDTCPTVQGQEGDPCYAGPLFTSGEIIGCTCIGQGSVPCTTDLTLEFQSDLNNSQTTWELVEQGTNFVVRTGGPLPAANSVSTTNTCLPNGCYVLRVLDSAGDGMAMGTGSWSVGGYILRTQGTNLRIIDNRNNFDGVHDGDVSQIANGQAFCLPLGTDRTISTSCDKVDWVEGKFIMATENTAVSAQFGVTNATSGYEFWFFDPNGSYSFRRFRSHATSDGTGTGALRACHFRINSWTNTVSTPHLPSNKLLNVRIRGRVAGVNLPFGPACQFKIDPVLAACPRTTLQDNVANTSDFSCGVNRVFGGSNSSANKVVAHPPQFVPTVASSNVRYQFRFRLPGEHGNPGSCIVRPVQTSPALHLNWTTGDRLKCNTQYDVDVRVSKDGGATWCIAGGAPTCEAPGTIELWGKVCKVNITSSTYCPASSQDGANSIAAENNGTFTMYPNPNRGDQLYINLSVVEKGVTTVSVDIFDLTGKKVAARMIAVQDGFVNSALELNEGLSNGMYLVNVTAGGKAYTERLVIQR